MVRTLLASYHFPPSSAVGALRPGRLARLLPDFGYQVDVVCAAPGNRMGATDPSREYMVPEGSAVTRLATPFVLGRDPDDLPQPPSLLARAWWKARAHWEWRFLTEDWSWRWGEAARHWARGALEKDPLDLLILDAPPNPAIVPLVRLAGERGIPAVLDLRDLWWCGEPGRTPWWFASPGLRRQVWETKLRDEAVQAATRIVLSSGAMVKMMREWYPDKDPKHFSAVTNAFESVDSAPGPPLDPPSQGALRLVYAGSLAYGRMEQAKALLRGIAALEGKGGPLVTALFVGDGGEELRSYAEELGNSQIVQGMGWLERDRATEIQRGAGALLLLQPWTHVQTRVAIPGKLFDYMARRRSIFGMISPGPAAEIIRDHDLGIVVSSEEPDDIAAALGRLVERVENEPFLNPPPHDFSDRHTTAQFARVLDGAVGITKAG